MSTTVTITSKRQLTIPKNIWNKLDLEGVRYLKADIEGNTLKLQKDDFYSELNKFWDKTQSSVKGDVSDASIKEASRLARVNKTP